MNVATTYSNQIMRVIVPVIVLSLAGWLIIDTLDSGANPLAEFCKYIGLIMVLLAIVLPRNGLVALLFACAYLDLLKRLLILWDVLSYNDLAYVLGIAPAAVGGLCLYVAGARILNRIQLHALDFILAGVILALIALTAVVSFKHGDTLTMILKDIANGGFYAVLLLVISKICRDGDDIRSLLRTATYVFIPVALYGIYQSIFGLSSLEVEYLKSGFTIMSKELTDLRPRPFSTMNSASALGFISATMCLLSLLPIYARGRTKNWRGSKWAAALLALLYLTACLASLARAANIVWIVGLMGMYCFRTRKGTIAFYTAAIAAFTTLILSAPYLLRNIAYLDLSRFSSSDASEQLLRIQTYSERLKGFENLTASTDMYSWFGLPENRIGGSTTYSHDGLTQFMMTYGVLPLVITLAVLAVGTFFTHRTILLLPAGPRRNLAIVLFSISLSLLLGDTLFGFVLGTFPIGTFFWLFNGSLVLLLFRDKNEQRAPQRVISRRLEYEQGGFAPQFRISSTARS